MKNLDINVLSKYQGLEKMIVETDQNISRLEKTIASPYHHPVYIHNCKLALESYRRDLKCLKAAHNAKSNNVEN
ncbi:hypothetical protein U0N46_004340 [Vibrio parahaemolyticus]|nr:hypothetical protein [Vibrio parahaemolyticus]ELA9722345.1 hypothetical protein [Vibrio parahaemolyticus]ELZ7234074.1 hypothetical protein [Vibrio parahaemolyticus]